MFRRGFLAFEESGETWYSGGYGIRWASRIKKAAGEADHLGIGESIVAVCFPAACATASSFDTDLMNEMGKTLGEECQAENLSVLLGPAVNIKRSLSADGILNIYPRIHILQAKWLFLYQRCTELGRGNEHETLCRK